MAQYYHYCSNWRLRVCKISFLSESIRHTALVNLVVLIVRSNRNRASSGLTARARPSKLSSIERCLLNSEQKEWFVSYMDMLTSLIVSFYSIKVSLSITVG